MARVLAVDDSAAIRQMISFSLKAAGHQVQSCATGEQALAYLQYHTVDIIFTDINMPGMDGFLLAQAVREMPDLKHVPIVALTTETLADSKIKGKKSGISGWLVKPFQPDKLCSVVQRVTG